jgi:hypothetical protein
MSKLAASAEFVLEHQLQGGLNYSLSEFRVSQFIMDFMQLLCLDKKEKRSGITDLRPFP